MNLSFLMHWLNSPASVGAIAPSSRYLADAMTEEVGNFDAIVEVGAGTGAITRALVQKHPHADLVLFELADNLAGKLALEYPQARVIAGPFHEQALSLSGLPERTIFVSGLPFRSLPAEVVTHTVDALATLLGQSSYRKLVQFTYQPRAPFRPPVGFKWERRRTIWRNAPPASVWHLSHTSVPG